MKKIKYDKLDCFDVLVFSMPLLGRRGESCCNHVFVTFFGNMYIFCLQKKEKDINTSRFIDNTVTFIQF